LRSGYLHGDQSAGYEVVLTGAVERGGAASIVGQFSQHRVAAYAAQYAVLLMEAIGEAVGRSFTVNILGPKLSAAFSLERSAVMMERHKQVARRKLQQTAVGNCDGGSKTNALICGASGPLAEYLEIYTL
jgi:hypothetical protein